MDLNERVTSAAIGLFEDRGIRFTMDELARRLRMSKRTIYEQVGTKEEILEHVINEAFASIKAREAAIIADPDLDVVSKLRQVLTAMPVRTDLVNPAAIAQVREAYPAKYDLIVEHLSTGWEATLELYAEAVRQGRLRPVNPLVLREVLLAAMEHLLRDDTLRTTGVTHEQALAEIVDLVFTGLETHA
jgi:AcrR family transcriptional regulator